jgi:hypothetical protein
MAMKIEIGAGTKPTPGYVHVDAVVFDEVDVIDDGRTLSKFEDGVAEEIFSHWFFEHVARHEVKPMLANWQRVLAPGGKIRVVTNNHEAHNRCLAEGQITWKEWSYLIYGNRPGYTIGDLHKCAWNKETLEEILQLTGYLEVSVEAQWKCREKDGRLKCPALIAQALKPM